MVLLVLFLGCARPQTAEKRPELTRQEQEEMLLRVNKYLVEKDYELMNAYADRKGWEVESTETGLLYQICRQTGADRVNQGELVTIAYEISLLDGTVSYDSDEDGLLEFRLGNSQEIAGLEQGIAMMGKGEMARFIIPPHLGYGLIGDEKRIPARAIIVYEVELLDVQR